MRNVKVLVLCAGEGKRLRPYTEHQPKCLVPYRGKPLLQYQLDVFQQLHITDITLIGGYRAEALPKNYPIVINPDYATTNMVYSLFCARSRMTEDADCIVSYGDILYHASVLQTLLEDPHPIGVVTDDHWKAYWSQRMGDPLQDAETFRWEETTHRLLELGKKPTSLSDIQGQYIGLVKISASEVIRFQQTYGAFVRVTPTYRTAYMTDLIQFCIDQKLPVFGVPIKGRWAEFDTVTDLTMERDIV